MSIKLQCLELAIKWLPSSDSPGAGADAVEDASEFEIFVVGGEGDDNRPDQVALRFKCLALALSTPGMIDVIEGARLYLAYLSSDQSQRPS